MRKSYQSVLCSHSSIAFTLTAALLLAAVVMSPARAFAKDNNNAYVPNNNGTVSVIDAKTDTVIATIPAGFNHPFCATMSPNGKLV
jgi:YVTN family beta-propeller protein